MRAVHRKEYRVVGGARFTEKRNEISPLRFSPHKHHILLTFLPLLLGFDITRSENSKLEISSLQIIYLMHVYSSFLEVQVGPSPCKRSTLIHHKWASTNKTCLNFTGHVWRKYTKRTHFSSYILMIFRKRYTGQYIKGYYQKEDAYKSWNHALGLCQTFGAFLPVIRNIEEFHFVLAFLKLSPYVKFVEGLYVSHSRTVSV